MPPEIEGYRYIRPLGRGGFADVFLYEQRFPQRDVAVKVLRSGVDDGFRDRFAEEANVMARLSAHPSIVTILAAAFAADGRPYLVMEYCPYPHLGQRVRNQPLSVAETLKTGIQIAGAVESAHRLGIIHRDIKPANILVTAYRHPALTDFGISATMDRSRAFGVSVPWAPPEQIDEEPVTVRSDVYALAATLYHLLAGRSPFGGDKPGQAMAAIAELVARAPVPPIGRDDVPPALERVLVKAMAKKPSDRYSSVIQLARALQQVQHEVGLQVTQIEAMDQSVPPSQVHFEDNGQTVIAAPRTVAEAPPGRTRDAAFGRDLPAVPVEMAAFVPPADPDRTRVRADSPGAGTSRAGHSAAGDSGSRPTRRRRVSGWLAAAGGVLLLTTLGAGGWAMLGRESGGPATSSATTQNDVPVMRFGEPIEWRYIPAGNCIESTPKGGYVREMTAIPCDQPHEAYLLLVGNFPQELPYPGDQQLADQVLGMCTSQLTALSAINGDPVENYGIHPLGPDQHSWESIDYRDRGYGCLAFRTDGSLMVGSLAEAGLQTVPNPSAPPLAPEPQASEAQVPPTETVTPGSAPKTLSAPEDDGQPVP